MAAGSDDQRHDKVYVLAEFPYPSGSGLHIGHTFTYTAADVYARFLRMQGRHVLFPMGWDAFGLPTENFAIRTGRKPQDVTRENTQNYQRQMQALGFSFDWERTVNTTDPAYYKWTQWIFIQLFRHGLAFKQEMPINWCPKDKIGLANEEVINGRCERCGTETTKRLISQWVVKITAYADRLLEGLEHTDFIPKVKASQINWIGRSEGANILFRIQDQREPLKIFTTRPDTLWGCTFMVVAPEHPLAAQAASNPDVARYIEAAGKQSEFDRTDVGREKSGVFSGIYANHPATGERLPVWISDFVLMSYGSGAIMAVPAHDARDYEFARKYDLPIKPVIMPDDGWDFSQAAYTERQGTVVDSGPITGLSVNEAIPAAADWLVQQGLGEPAVTYHMRDWIFSRQHYWGEPIPMIYCQDCGWVPVPDEDLPVVLPEVEHYQPTDTGESPLAIIDWWVKTSCPQCSGPARRETDTMPNWAGSDWYFLRYTDPHNDQKLADMEKMRYWLPVDVYIGGDEHNTLHLLYSRFIYNFLYDIGSVPPEYPEPYQKRISHGVILGPDGARMSKSRGNVVVPDEMIAKYGADVVRAYLMFIGPFDATMAWNERALAGVRRFLERFERFITENAGKHSTASYIARVETNRVIKGVTEDIPQFKFNTALAKMMEGLNTLIATAEPVRTNELRTWLQLLAPIAPFLAETLWQKIGQAGSVHTSGWPEFDQTLVEEEKLEIPVQVNGRLRGVIRVNRDDTEEQVRMQAEALDTVQKYLRERTLQKVIYIPGRTLNFVVR
jgi:leucyl-tRNA synthetase